MNKKTIIILLIGVVIFLSGVIGYIYYIRTPNYIIKKYIKAINKGDYNTMESMEYNYENFEISRFDVDGCYISKIEEIDHGNNQDFIDAITTQMYETNYKKIDNSHITYISLYKIDGENLYYFPYIAVGKVRNKNMIVYSPFYYVK